jgi:hypothetical protein
MSLHLADDLLVGSNIRYLSNFSAAPHVSERPESAHSCLCASHREAATVAP